MKLNNVKVNNFLIISEADIKPDSKLNIFCGRNRSGKTSLIKAIQTGLLGTTDPSVIKIGTEKAEIMIDIDQYKIQRTITKKGQRVKVTNAEGDIKANPQTFLNGLLGDFSFDPIAFVLMEGKDRKKYLMELFNPKVKVEMLQDFIDADLLDRIKDNLDKMDGLQVLKNLEDIYYSKRTDINKQLAQKKAFYQEAIPKGYSPDEPFNENAVEELTVKLKEVEGKRDAAKDLEKANENAEKMRGIIGKKIADYEEILSGIMDDEISKIPEYEKQIQLVEEQITALQATLSELKTYHEDALQHRSVKMEALENIEEQKTSLEDFPLWPVPYITGMEGEILNLDAEIFAAKSKNLLRQKYLTALEIGKDADALEVNSKSLSVIIDKLRKDIPAQIVKEANIPIEGIRIEGDKVMIGETSIDNMSTSEQVRIGLTIVRALNKDAPLKLLCLDRAESLDDVTLKEFADQIQEDEFQYILTYVQHGEERPEGSILVEGGEVKA